ncbi:Poly(U)-binding-splicing factor puf60 [Cichlidogyrus casuarinus]|uniref:Poly(U)-binding-splicing factor puf60 n=1 Tax=Cichlidogyrus casuarinus TaxID=1844966 RepID=A0ABD2QFK5_9PLAT
MNSVVVKTFSSMPNTQKEPYGPIIHGPGASKKSEPYCLRVLEMSEREALAKAKKYAMEQSLQVVLKKQSINFATPAVLNLQKQQTLTMLNRIYVGSVNYDVTDAYVRDHFIQYGPIKSITMSWEGGTTRHKGYGFVEYEFPESAILATEQSNGLQFHGRIMKVGRPTNLPDPAPLIKQFIEEHDLKRRIFLIGVHQALNDADVEQVFSPFGKITRCKLETEIADPSTHRGLGYVDYSTEQSANIAVNSMNRFELGGKLLRVTKAICPPEFIRSFQNEVKPSHMMQQPVPEPIKPVSPPAAILLPPTTATESIGLLLLLNMVTVSEIDNELVNEVTEECQNFGQVKDVKIIPNPASPDEVRIFVVYSPSSAVDSAILSLDGRFFSGRKVVATRYDLSAYKSGNYFLQ